MKKQLFFMCGIIVLSHCSTKTELHRPQVMSDEEKEELVEEAIKETFGTVVANMVTAAQNPELKPQCLSNMIQAFLNLIFTATKQRPISRKKLLDELIQMTYQIDHAAEIRTTIETLKDVIQETQNIDA